MRSQTLLDWFVDSWNRAPNAVALEVRDVSYTYAELARAAARVAARLDGDPRPQRVGVLATKSLPAYAGYLAGLWLGAAVVPMNASFPTHRNQAIIDAGGVDALVVGGASSFADGLRLPHGCPVVSVPAHAENALVSERLTAGAEAHPVRVPIDETAYVMFTSGSTGRPKGVPVTHRNLSSFIEFNVARYEVGVTSRLSQTFDLTFDPSVFDMFVAWAGGATLVAVDNQQILDPVDAVNRLRLTHWYSVPSVISMAGMLDRLPAGSMRGLRWSLFAGEPFTLDAAAAWADAAPESCLENLYGPTELTVTVTAYRLPAEREAWPQTSNGTVPIGKAYPHLDGIVLEEKGEVGREGELCVRGEQRFGGYLDPADNAARFLHQSSSGFVLRTGAVDVADWYRTGDHVSIEQGNLVHRGRADHQIKIRGHRVELGEIEYALRCTAGISTASVEFADINGVPELLASYTGDDWSSADLARSLRATLPAYMVPNRYLRVAQFPLNANGKIDRAELIALHKRAT